MTEPTAYVPPEVWTHRSGNGGRFAGINRPTAGARHDAALPTGRHPLQLYSAATPNGVKATVMLEELLALGRAGAEYDAWFIDIMEGNQFGSGFVALNPNSKIPVLLDRGGAEPVRVFESGSILLHLAEKFDALLPASGPGRAETLSWLMWQMGAGPLLGGGFGHFYAYAPAKLEYPIDRYAMEAKRQLDVLDKRLAETAFLAGADYSIADIAAWPWYGQLSLGTLYAGEGYDAARFLALDEYRHLRRWAETIAERPAVKRGRLVNKASGGLRERHDAAELDRLVSA